ncbi:hypothetical protein [Flavobacterium sp. H122]|uniref:hypothetical protein n=1 Tax=Flavobacterium sp. H122 TaxID=2529860 RepID=UPI0010A9EA9E|nr:hypothetical protein [Flavobacterium sp. H122]
MTENIKYFSKLSLSGIISFLKINILTTASTVTIGIIGFIILTKNINAGNSGHVSAIPFLVMTFGARPIGSILWYIVILGSPFLFFALGNKYVLTKLANRIIVDKSDTLLNPVLDKLFNKFKANQSNTIKSAADYSMNKLKLIENIKKDKTENKWLKRIIVFGMKKVKMDDVDFNKEGQNFHDILKLKTIETLKDISEPDKTIIWITLGVQWGVLLFIWLTKF